jgi:very-short-patch-repair endonuclease
MARQTSKRTVVAAQRLRRAMSLPEVLLWGFLRQADLRFRRQQPCGPFVADFYCAAAKVIIEIDGLAHDTAGRPERDQARDGWLQEQGYRVVRIPAREVLADVSAVAEAIVAMCRELAPGPSTTSPAEPRSPSPSASPTGRN